MARAINLSKKLFTSNIPNKVTESGDLMLDMTGYKSSEQEALRAEVVARRILSDELEGNYDIGALIGADEHGNLWIYSSEESKAAAMQKSGIAVLSEVGGRIPRYAGIVYLHWTRKHCSRQMPYQTLAITATTPRATRPLNFRHICAETPTALLV
jgi:phosphatidate phosphatase PAH1